MAVPGYSRTTASSDKVSIDSKDTRRASTAARKSARFCQTTSVDVHDEELGCQQLVEGLAVRFQQGTEEARIGIENRLAVGDVVGWRQQ
jgi:hypothetical protein